MTRVYVLVSVIILISLNAWGQCTNSPTIRLSLSNGSTCGTTPVTVDNNTFGGSATRVKIVTNGNGTINPGNVTTSPFSFTYTPDTKDFGKQITLTFTTDNPLGSPCAEAIATFLLTVNSVASAPIPGATTQPTCTVATGSVALRGLPASGPWTVLRMPDNVSTVGTGTTTTISGIPPGTYNFTVLNPDGCSSAPSGSVVIQSQPSAPSAPVQNTDCTLGPGNGVVTLTSPVGPGLEYNIDGSPFQSGTTFSQVADGNHILSVRNSAGCITTGNAFLVSCICSNPPTLTLGSKSGSTCSSSPLTISGNSFGGSATLVTFSVKGGGTVSPGSVVTHQFDFTYTPAVSTSGYKATITVSTNNPMGYPCANAVDSFTVTINGIPSAPQIGTITQPTCNISAGSVMINGLPQGQTWTITRNPGGVKSTGTGTSTTISSLPSGTYTFAVTDVLGCTSVSSANAVIAPVPSNPSAPVIGTISPPTCSASTGSVLFSGLPATGTWTLTRYPGTVVSTGSGQSTTISGLPSGLCNFTVTNSDGCTSGISANISIPAPPLIPSAPVIGAITQPRNGSPTGSVVISGLPASGSWSLNLTPGNVTLTGSGTSQTVTGLSAGTYRATVTINGGCTSDPSAGFTINALSGTPNVLITNPPPVCFPLTVDLTAPGITSGSSPGLEFSYWIDAVATIPFGQPATATSGTYYIKGTTTDGFFSVKPVVVTVYRIPVANAGPDQVLPLIYQTNMKASLDHTYEAGTWSLISGTGQLSDAASPQTKVTGLSSGRNVFLWTVTNGVCPASSDSAVINVRDKAISTLITPNMDGRNDYLILKGTDATSKMQLYIFDKRGVEVYKSYDYENTWNGVDHHGNQLPDDTYFYVVKNENGSSFNGFIVIRR